MTELGFRERNEIYSSYPCCVARCFADEYGGAWHEIETFKEMLKAKGIITNLPNFTNLDERRAFLESDMFSEITNRYYQALNEDEKAIFIDALSYKIVSDYVPAIGSKHQDALSLKYRKEGYDIDTPEGMKMLKTTTKIFSVLEDDSKFDHVRPEVLKGALELGTFKVDSQRLEAILKIASFDEEKDYIGTYLGKIGSEAYSQFNLTVNQIEKLKSDNPDLADMIIQSLTDGAKKNYLQSDEHRLSVLKGKKFIGVLAEYIDSVQGTDLGTIKERQKDLEILLRQKGIEIEFSEPISADNLEEFLISDNFKSMVNR